MTGTPSGSLISHVDPSVPQMIPPAATTVPPAGLVMVKGHATPVLAPPSVTWPKVAPQDRAWLIDTRPEGAQSPVKPLNM